ncbi:MAG: hypothetical protein GW795_06860 [Cyanobacteria bacterium]|nr:hypothetical protein [Cyanobacteria bacterium CG_2015-16_32_12]NCO78758.1 hypothetical protein [Cyanobacteria bacterium CG_2015-22_32_23]NCQ03144.1 hypothetical protein [Cyanobacteria bacterium CG_2015-09_32_10]NCQ41602.1 hypothetical protein [Cyanobacteria bacterium CG_2015-04_32_10]NCS83627.1 hypothetical protein [Cyanobacteria bacterium CG_2015-02_32_10]
MVNRLRQEDTSLTTVDYNFLLEQILRYLEEFNPFIFSSDNQRLKIDIDEIAYQIAMSDKVNFPANLQKSDRLVSINLKEKSVDNFIDLVRKIKEKLEALLLVSNNKNQPLEKTIQNLLTDLSKWKDIKEKGFKYGFNDVNNIRKQKLCIPKQEEKTPSKSILKLHRLTIKVNNINEFEEEIKKSLKDYVETNFSSLDLDTYEELEENLEEFINYKQHHKNNRKSPIENLIDLVKSETIARLKKEAKICYLKYILQQLDVNKYENAIYLQDLIRRLNLLEDYLNDKEKVEGDYKVNYEGFEVSYRDLFAKGETYDILPIIPMVEGYLGENSNETKGEKTFTFALKLKLNGEVKNQGEKGEIISSFDYYLTLLNPESKQHKEEIKKGESGKQKILKIALLFTFIFASRLDVKSNNYEIKNELTYNPQEFWENNVIEILKGSDEEKKKEIFTTIYKGIKRINAKEKIARLENLLKTFLTYTSLIPLKTYPLQIGIRKNILQTNAETINREGNFFCQEIKTKDCLKYLAIGEARVNDNYLCHLPVSFTMEDIRYYDTEETQSLTLTYNLSGIKVLPVVILPLEDSKTKTLYSQCFKEESLILFSYNHFRLSWVGINKNSQIEESKIIFQDYQSPKAFVYRFVFSLLTYLAMEVILQSVSQKIFIPIMRLHIKDNDLPYNEEHFIRSYSKILAHLLRNKNLANTQGLNVKENGRDFRLKNSLSSLYSVLPKNFTAKDTNNNYQPQLEKLALIIVSSREADANYKNGDNGNSIANLYGETIRIVKEGNKVTVINDQTFNSNYDKQMMYENPTILVDEVERLYQDGFRHFLYIAKSPYSSNLNVTHEDKDLFFMSKIVLEKMKGEGDKERKDIHIYPIFFDKYFVVKLGGDKQSTSLYTQDTQELTNLFKDESQKSVVFFNLFNGLVVGKSGRNYRGVMSYSTLLNTYQGVLDNQDISRGLIDDRENNQLKNDILHYLSLFHFSRYEQHKTSGISFKLNPYENIIGDSSIGKHCLFPFNKKIDFNILAFLTQVKRILY